MRRASIKKTPSGTFQMKILLDNRDGTLTIVPPNPGDDGGFVLSLGGGSAYCAAFGGAAGGTEARDDATHWLVKRPLAEECPAPAP